jgi:uncharacterized protein
MWPAAGGTPPPPPPPAPPPQFGGYAHVRVAAGVWRRTGAGLLDLLLVAVGAGVVTGVISNAAASADLKPGSSGGLVVAAVIQLLVDGGAFVYLFAGISNGATPGMRAAGLRIAAGDGSLPRTDQTLLRMAAGFWELLLLPVSLITVGVSRERRSWADRLSGTTVLHTSIRPWWWTWNGAQWTPTPADASTVELTTRREPIPAPRRTRWTWTDVVPIAVLQLPVALVGQLAVVTATRAVGLGRPAPSVGSLILDVVAYGLIATLIWLFLGLRRKATLADLGMRPVRWRWLVAVIPALLVAYAAEAVGGELGEAFLPSSPPTQCHDIQNAYGSNIALALLGVAVVAPLVEEVLFRGVVFGWMRGRVALPVAVLGSAAVFAAAHVLYRQWTLLPPIFAIGCVLALLYNYSRSLWPGIAVHASINTVATLALLTGAVHC